MNMEAEIIGVDVTPLSALIQMIIITLVGIIFRIKKHVHLPIFVSPTDVLVHKFLSLSLSYMHTQTHTK